MKDEERLMYVHGLMEEGCSDVYLPHLAIYGEHVPHDDTADGRSYPKYHAQLRNVNISPMSRFVPFSYALHLERMLPWRTLREHQRLLERSRLPDERQGVVITFRYAQVADEGMICERSARIGSLCCDCHNSSRVQLQLQALEHLVRPNLVRYPTCPHGWRHFQLWSRARTPHFVRG